MNQDDWRTPFYHHESGHVVAAVKRGGHVVSIELSEIEPETDVPVDPASRPFVIWAGPWAQAYLEGEDNCTLSGLSRSFKGRAISIGESTRRR
jgi:phage terminase large subunit-like protein